MTQSKRGATSMDANKTKRMKSIKEKSNEYANEQDLRMAYNGSCDNCRQGFVAGANYVLDEIEKELTRRMLVDYNQGAEEDEVAQGCMATMIMFIRQLKK